MLPGEDTQAAAPADPEAESAPASEDTAPEASPQPEAPEAVKALTPEEVRAIAREESRREAQSQVARSENRQNERIRQRFEELERNKGALKLSEEQIAQARQQIVQEELSAAPSPAGEGRLPAPGADDAHPLWHVASPMFDEAGVTVMEGDPEFDKHIKPFLEKPQLGFADVAKFTKAVETAIGEKQARDASKKAKASVRSPGGTGGSPPDPGDISNITDSTQLYQMGEKRLRRS